MSQSQEEKEAFDSKGITIYGASSPLIPQAYLDAAREAGAELARRGVNVICGGGRAGIMAAAIEGALDAGGTATGVLPEFMIRKGWQHPRLSRMEVTDGMHERKELMARLSRGVIAMPGGVGTLEELLEIITWRQLGLYKGNIVILNVDGYYDPLLAMLQRTIDQHFMNADHATLWQVATDPSEAVELVLQPPLDCSYTQKL